MLKSAYRNQQKDIGYDSDLSDLAGFLDESHSRCPTVFKYWSNSKNEEYYNLKNAEEQIKLDAKDFLDKKASKLKEAEKILDSNCSLVCTIEPELLGNVWFEGIDWLEEIFRQAATRDDIEIENCCDLTKEQFTLQKVEPLSSASNGIGFGENLLDSSNDWMIRYLRKNTERMIDLAGRFTDDTGLKARTLNLAAKEVLLSQASDWSAMIHDKIYPDYAKEQFIKAINGFSTVYESLGSNSISTEWLTKLEREHNFFPWTNYKVFSKKK
jgi:1,4-alpha-glucan branching enzyme